MAKTTAAEHTASSLKVVPAILEQCVYLVRTDRDTGQSEAMRTLHVWHLLGVSLNLVPERQGMKIRFLTACRVHVELR